MSKAAALAAFGLALAGLQAGSAAAQSLEVRTPDVATSPPPTSVTVNGRGFVNHGLVAVGRVDATLRDFRGESLSGFSGMAVDPRAWRRRADGSYSGTLFALPDRGPNDVGTIHGTTAYQNRLHAFRFSFTPWGEPGPTDRRMALTLTGGLLLRDQTGQTFSGRDPGDGVITRGGVTYPAPASGDGAGHISLDSEGIARLRDGSFYISDEYAAMIYAFDARGRQTGAIAPPASIQPRLNGQIHYGAAAPGMTGRRNNQGLEAVAVTPDQTRLITILQSATLQDNSANLGQNRNNTRVLVYDISHGRTPAAPIGDYVLQLPVVRANGDGGAPDATAAQSEAVALNDHQLLVLARDSNGRGSGVTRPIVYRSVLLVDLSGATNLAGTSRETGVEPVTQPGTNILVAGVTAATAAALVNINDPTDLARFGQNTRTGPSDAATLPEKLEGMALLPALDPATPDDWFLFVGSDNDFLTPNGRVNGVEFNAALTGAGGEGANDPIVLVYRLTLPTLARSR